MTPELRRRMLTLAHAIDPLLQLAVDAESHALPGLDKEGLLKARHRLTVIQAWLAGRVAETPSEKL